MKIACVTAPGLGETDLLMAQVAARLEGEGRALAGIVKLLEQPDAPRHHCDMEVRVLPDGPVIAITQNLGKESTSCRLNPAAIAEAVAAVESRPLDHADMFLLNKFGPEEAAGRGFCGVIGSALERGLPVLVGVGAPSRAAFDAFAGGMAVDLPADLDALCDWCRDAMVKA